MMPGSPIDRLWRVQGGRCFHCGEPMLRGVVSRHDLRWTREHLYPRAFYPPNSSIVLAHRQCNSARGCRHPSGDDIVRAKAIYAVAELPWRGFAPQPARAGGKTLVTLAELWPARAV